MAKIEDKLKILPALPGCYLMKNKDGDIIYVGKAKKLKNRVRQYFVGAHDFKTTRLVSNIGFRRGMGNGKAVESHLSAAQMPADAEKGMPVLSHGTVSGALHQGN